MTSLYNLTAEYQELLRKEELTDADLKAIDEKFADIEDKGVQYAFVIKEMEAKLALTEDMIKMAQAKKKRLEGNLDRVKANLVYNMVCNKIEHIDRCPLFDIKIRHNAPAVEDYDPDAIPVEYFNKKETLTLDKKRVKEDIENLGLVIPGVRLVRGISLQIK